MGSYESSLQIDFRKQEGIFYSPNFITNYIITETVNEYLESKGNGFGTLQNIKILDLACGAGAFLVESFDFLLQKYQAFFPNFSNPEKWIIENNLFGVDLDKNAVEICKQLLLEKSGFVCENIKQGNSLIDDKEIDERAFDWKKEFPKAKDGFDLIVGNPPYVDIKLMPNELAKHFFRLYETAENRINLYAIFIERALQLLKNDGILSFIVPNSLLVNSSYLKIRQKLYQGIEKIIKLPDSVFKDANVETIIFKYRHNHLFETAQALVFPHNEKIDRIVERDKLKFQTFNKKNWNGKFLTFNIYADEHTQNITRKCFTNSEVLEKHVDFSLGITPYDKYKGHSEQTIKNREFHAEKQIDETYKPLLEGSNITRFLIYENVSEYIKYGDWLGAKREERFFTEPRIIIRQILSGKPPRIYAGFTDKPFYFTQIGFSILPKNEELDLKYLLALLNSKLISFVHKYKFTDIEKEIFGKFLIENCRNLPIKVISQTDQKPFIDRVNILLENNQHLQKKSQQFLKILKAEFKFAKVSDKLKKWYELDWEKFQDEMNRLKTPILGKKKLEWLEVFEEESSKVISISKNIQTLEKEIDDLVYQLYNLTAEEIKIVENG